MDNKNCPRCGNAEMLSELTVHGGNGNPPFVQIAESRPEKPPFMWVPKLVQSQVTANVCVSCGYTEFYAVKREELAKAKEIGFQKA